VYTDTTYQSIGTEINMFGLIPVMLDTPLSSSTFLNTGEVRKAPSMTCSIWSTVQLISEDGLVQNFFEYQPGKIHTILGPYKPTRYAWKGYIQVIRWTQHIKVWSSLQETCIRMIFSILKYTTSKEGFRFSHMNYHKRRFLYKKFRYIFFYLHTGKLMLNLKS